MGLHFFAGQRSRVEIYYLFHISGLRLNRPYFYCLEEEHDHMAYAGSQRLFAVYRKSTEARSGKQLNSPDVKRASYKRTYIFQTKKKKGLIYKVIYEEVTLCLDVQS